MARVILGSSIAHAALIAVLDVIADGAPKRPAAKAPPTIELVDVERVPEPAPERVDAIVPVEVAIHAPRPRSTSRSTTSAPAITTAPPTIAPSVEVPPSDVPASEAPIDPGPSMHMRPGRGDGLDLAIHQDVAPEVPATQRESGSGVASDKKLKPNGTAYVAPDLVTTMHVAPDGRARFEDKPDIEVRFLPVPNLDVKQTAKDLGNWLAGWYRDPYAQTKARRYQDMPRHEQAVPGGWDAGAGGDGDIDGSIKQPDEITRRGGGILGGKLDITSWLHRKYVGDPYASRKRALLDGTIDERAQIRATHTRGQLDRSAVMMRANVDRVFAEIGDPIERRVALFALWDECAEGEGATGEAGDRARAIVIGAIRARLSGSPDRYTNEEIAALDARRTSVQHFVPYE